MKLLKTLAFCFLLILGFTAVAKAEDTIYLKDGKVVHGKIIKRFPSGSVKIRTASGKETVYKKSSIKNIVHTDSAPVAMSATPKKAHHHAETVYSGTINGVNTIGRPGYFFSDTAYTPNKGVFEGAAGAYFNSIGGQPTVSSIQAGKPSYNQLLVPFGVAFGITDQLQVQASSNFYASGATGLGYLTFGGKYRFKTSVDNLLFALGLDLSDGPLTGSPYTTFNFDPYGIVTYTFADGLQLNGQLGIQILSTNSTTTPIGGITVTTGGGSTSYVQFNAGAAYPLSDKITGIAELDVNGNAGGQLYSGSTPLIVGIRTGHDVQLQAFGGLDLAGTVGVIIGGDVALVSQ